jgi:ABC-type sugar transport system ATPase subunit/ribose/xylose/arabinose/galactoside ABC-type transport system permease subunit
MNEPVEHPAALVEVQNVSRRFPGVVALDDVSLTLEPGTVHALLGENGAGKSTLINILSGVLRPDAGVLRVHGQEVTLHDARAARRLGLATVHQEADLFPDLTVAENLALEHGYPTTVGLIRWRALRRRMQEALAALDCAVDPDRRGGGLSAGARQLMDIAAALAQKANVLILDEPTSSLSAAEASRLFDHLRAFRNRGGAILYVSHRLEEVFALADVATVLRDGRRVWSGPLAGTTAEQLIAYMVGRERAAVPERSQARPGPVCLACRQLTVAGGSCRDISLEVRAGEILGLYGLVGAGRSEWAQALFGLRPISGGAILINGLPYQPRSPGAAARHRLAYLPDDRLRYGLFARLSVRLNAVLAALRRLSLGPFLSTHRETQLAQTEVDRLAVRLHSLLQPAGTLSGGNQQKVILGRWLACEPNVFVLDEPTRGVDVGAKAEIHALLHRLAEAGRAIILISSELPEVLTHSHRIGVFRTGRLVGLFDPRKTTAEAVAAAALPVSIPESTASRETSVRHRLSSFFPFSFFLVPFLREAGVLLVALLLAVYLAWRTQTFWQAGTLRNVAENTALLALCGLGAALVILAGGIDMSFGSIMALGAATAGYLMQEGWPAATAAALGLAIAAAAGALNAALCLVGRVHPIIITLGTLSLYRGLTLGLIGGRDIYDVPSAFAAPIRAAPFGIPAVVWVALGALALAWFLLGWTVPGRRVLALGGNPAAAERTGIHRGRVWLAVFTVQGFLAGVAGLLALGLVGSMQSTDFAEKTLEAIGVAIVGGVAITGGRGSVWGVAAAALLFQVLEKGWVLLRISAYWQRTIVGSLLLLAILGDRLWRHGEDQDV